MRRAAFILAFLLLTAPCGAKVITVDDDGPADYNNIQAAIDSASDADTIIVQPGLYKESINFLGKNVTLTSTNPADPNIVCSTIIGKDSPQYNAVDFKGTEDASCILSGFNIKGVIDGSNCFPDDSHTHATISHCLIRCNGSQCGTVIRNCDGIIKNCLVADNGGTVCMCLCAAIVGCHGLIENCTIINNDRGPGIETANGETTIENCIIYGNHQYQLRISEAGIINVLYCDIQDGLQGVVWDGFTGTEELNWGPGNIDADPCFADPCNGDYHLQSAAGRWDPNSESWVIDANTSLCVDAGNPGCPVGSEPMPNGNRINMGAYGGTPTASKSPADWRSIADLTNDWAVDFNDLAVFVDYWLDAGECVPSDLNRSEFVNFADYAIFADNWRVE